MNLLPLDAVLGLLLYQSDSLQHISDIVDTPFLPHCQGVCRLSDRTKAMKITIKIYSISFRRLTAKNTDRERLLYLCQRVQCPTNNSHVVSPLIVGYDSDI